MHQKKDLYETAIEGKKPASSAEDDNYVTAHQYDRDDTAFEDEGLPDAEQQPLYTPIPRDMRGASKLSVASAHRIYAEGPADSAEQHLKVTSSKTLPSLGPRASSDDTVERDQPPASGIARIPSSKTSSQHVSSEVAGELVEKDQPAQPKAVSKMPPYSLHRSNADVTPAGDSAEKEHVARPLSKSSVGSSSVHRMASEGAADPAERDQPSMPFVRGSSKSSASISSAHRLYVDTADAFAYPKVSSSKSSVGSGQRVYGWQISEVQILLTTMMVLT